MPDGQPLPDSSVYTAYLLHDLPLCFFLLFVKTMLNLSETHDEVSVVCDQLGSPTSAVELAKAIHHFEGTENYGLYHATCEGDTNWADFTEEIFKRAGKSTKVNHVTSLSARRLTVHRVGPSRGSLGASWINSTSKASSKTRASCFCRSRIMESKP